MSRSKRQRLESTVAAIQRQHGMRALQKGSALPEKKLPPHISTSFSALDEITGCQGIPAGYMSLFTGPLGSGKLTVAYKALMQAQEKTKNESGSVAILSLNQQVHVDYLHRCQVNLQYLDIYQPPDVTQSADLLLHLVAGNVYSLILVDSVSDILAVPQVAREFNRSLTKLSRLLRTTSAGLLCIGEQTAPWISRVLNWDQLAPIRRSAALHVEFGIRQWLDRDEQWSGYRRIATVRKSRWGVVGASTEIDIEFNGTVKARTPG